MKRVWNDLKKSSSVGLQNNNPTRVDMYFRIELVEWGEIQNV